VTSQNPTDMTAQRPPTETADHVYSNIDHVLHDEVVAELQAHPERFALHAAWNFCSYVWFDGQVWREQVWRYGSPVETRDGEDLVLLIASVNDDYGHE
jgi:hypothetical protein